MKKIGSLVLSVILCFALLACNNNKPANKAHEELGYQWADVNAPIVKEKGLVDYNILSPKNAMADDYNDMKVFKDLYDSTNVGVNWDNISESAYAERKTLILGDSKNLPDAIYHAGFTDAEVIRYASRKTIIPISDYLDYMPNFKAILAARPDIKKIITSAEDGKIYTLPRVEEMGVLEYPNLLFLNKNWTQKAIDAGGWTLPAGETLADGLNLTSTQFENLLVYFKNNNMNGSTTVSEKPLSFVYQNWQGNQSDLYAMFGLTENIDHKAIINDKVVFTPADDKFKDATNNLRRWIKDLKIVDEEVLEITQDAFLASGRGDIERLGAFYWWESETVVKNPENYICLNPLIGPDGTQQVGLSNNPEIGKGYFVVTNKCANPEVLLTYMDRFFSPVTSAQINYGPIGVVYEEEHDADGKLVQKPIPEGKTTDEIRLKNAPLGVMYLSYEQWENTVNMEPRAKLRLERLTKYAAPFKQANAKPYPPVALKQSETNQLALMETNLNNFVSENLVTWLRSTSNISDSEWATFKTSLNTIGLQNWLDIYQAAYDRYNV